MFLRVGLGRGYGHAYVDFGAIKSVSYVFLYLESVFVFVLNAQCKTYMTSKVTAFKVFCGVGNCQQMTRSSIVTRLTIGFLAKACPAYLSSVKVCNPIFHVG